VPWNHRSGHSCDQTKRYTGFPSANRGVRTAGRWYYSGFREPTRTATGLVFRPVARRSRKRTLRRQSQHFGRMPLPTRRRQLETSILAAATQGHARQPAQAGIVRQTGWPADGGAQIQAVQRRAAAGLQIGLRPRHRHFRRTKDADRAAGGRTARTADRTTHRPHVWVARDGQADPADGLPIRCDRRGCETSHSRFRVERTPPGTST
jgi:hypothetical protein